MNEQTIALLIDGDNISAKYVTSILDELTEVGLTTIKRIYGDWTRPEMTKWREELLSKSLSPVQQFANVKGKNATDSALIIDAMDILYTKDVDVFCIVSSDSDFTRLSARIAESGHTVIGMGENKTPDAFRNACTRFVALENLRDTSGDVPKGGISQKGVEHVIANTIRDNENHGKETTLAEVGNRLNKKYPDFDVRSFGYSILSTFIEDMPRFKIIRNNNTVNVGINDEHLTKAEVDAFIHHAVESAPGKSITINDLSHLVYDHFDHFKLKDLGYSQFYKLVQSTKGVQVTDGSDGEKKASLQ